MIPIRYTFLVLLCCSLNAAQTAQAQCTSDAGTLNTAAQFYCEGAPLTITHDGNQTLDTNDIFLFVAYTSAAPNAATVFATSANGTFAWQADLLANSPFKIAAVVGDNAAGSVDWNDPCLSVSAPATVTYLPPPTVVVGPPLTLTCANTTVMLTTTANQPNCTFSWSGSGNFTSTVQNPSISFPGQYCVTVTNQGGCTDTQCVAVVADVTPPTVSIPAPSVLTCAVTSVVLNVNGPVQTTYFWTGPNGFASNQSSPVITVPGNYTLTVTNVANGCTATSTIVVNQDIALPTADAGPDTGIPCGGTQAQLSANGGAGAVSFAWSGPNNFVSVTQNPIAVQPGTYSLVVTNLNNGCTATDQLTVFPGPAIPLQNFTVANATCQGINTGSISLTPTVGQPPFDFAWTGPSGFNASTEDISGLAPGQYSLVATDATSCTYYANVTVGQTTGITIPPGQITITNVTCSGASDGVIVLTVAGGVPPFEYVVSWNGIPGSVFSDSDNQIALPSLPPGVYLFTVTDANGCSAVAPPLVITQPATTFFATAAPINCGDNSAQVTVVGGTPPYTYLWSNGTTTQVITDLSPGVYTITVTDANGCMVLATITIGTANPYCGLIIGKVWQDSLDNCAADPGELALEGWIVRANGLLAYYGVTDSTGTYRINVDEGDYTLTLMPPNALWVPCAVTLPLGLVGVNDTVTAIDFFVGTLATCPALSVSIGSNLLRRCFSNNYYYLDYCNDGTAPAEDAYILVTLDPFISPISASLPYTDLGNNVLRFDVGDLDIGECGAFNLKVQVSCDAVISQSHCTEAHIYPDSVCLPTNPLWSGASLQVTSNCGTDSVRFTIKNIGTGDMTETVDYIVVEDALMLMKAPVQLDAGASAILAFPANGSTWRVEMGQVPFHPGNSQPSLSVEGCSANTAFSTGFVTQFSVNDADPWIDIDCRRNVGSYDPNDKQGFPEGYGAAHYIRPGTELEYLIRFQNTGTDTAFTVRIADTLSAWLDPTTIRPGASSHSYSFDLSGPGIASFLFENILLPDSNVNQVGSNGFVKFSISPKENTPLETVIENDAAIYFDFNAPVVTNTTFHRLGENFLVGVWQPQVPGAEVSVSPNPFGDAAILEVIGLRSNAPLRLRVLDLQGIVVQEMETPGTVFTLKKGDWPTGVYLFSIQQEGKLVGSGKLAVK